MIHSVVTKATGSTAMGRKDGDDEEDVDMAERERYGYGREIQGEKDEY